MPIHVSGIFLIENLVFTGCHLFNGHIAPPTVSLTVSPALGFVPHPHNLQNPIGSIGDFNL